MATTRVRIAQNSVLRFSEVVELDGVTFWKPIKLPAFEADPSDVLYQVQSVDRIDNLAKRFYGDDRLHWVLMWANDFVAPEVEMYKGLTIRIPSRDRMLQTLLRG